MIYERESGESVHEESSKEGLYYFSHPTFAPFKYLLTSTTVHVKWHRRLGHIGVEMISLPPSSVQGVPILTK